MPRPLRVQYPGAIYHLMARGDRRQAIFADATDRQTFLDLLGRTCLRTGWQVHAYTLMGNHFHLISETPQPNLSVGMKWLLGVYTQKFNRRHGHWGHLFGGRYKAQHVDERDPLYLRESCDYVHLNAARAGMIAAGDRLETYLWSSYAAYLQPSRRAAWLRCDRLLGEHGIQRDDARGRREYARHLEIKRVVPNRQSDRSAAQQALSSERGWRVGAEDFADWLADQLGRRGRKTERARERSETDTRLAEKIVRLGLAEAGWNEQQLRQSIKGDPVKVRIAGEVREQTPMTLAWIAHRLQIGSTSYLAALLAAKRSVKSWN